MSCSRRKGPEIRPKQFCAGLSDQKEYGEWAWSDLTQAAVRKVSSHVAPGELAFFPSGPGLPPSQKSGEPLFTHKTM